MKRLFLDVHALQNLPPSNINRDDTGSPKTAQYGGVRRARVSSQSWKRAIRQYFLDHGEQHELGVRTLNIVDYVARKILELDPAFEGDPVALADKTINDAGVKTKDQKARALFFLGDKQARDLAQAALDGDKKKAELQAVLCANPAIDIALFGRMVADDPKLNEDASSQVAHAISTHAVQTEFDFYTAVDDLSEEDHAGAAMLDTIEFNSSTLYRYANVALHELVKQLGDKEATIKAVGLFVEAFANSLPTGKINTFANQTVPYTFLVTLRTDRPVNLVGAFETPVRSSEGYLENSEEKLFEEFIRCERFVEKPLASFYIQGGTMELADDCGVKEASLSELLSDLEARLNDVEFTGTEA